MPPCSAAKVSADWRSPNRYSLMAISPGCYGWLAASRSRKTLLPAERTSGPKPGSSRTVPHRGAFAPTDKLTIGQRGAVAPAFLLTGEISSLPAKTSPRGGVHRGEGTAQRREPRLVLRYVLVVPRRAGAERVPAPLAVVAVGLLYDVLVITHGCPPAPLCRSSPQRRSAGHWARAGSGTPLPGSYVCRRPPGSSAPRTLLRVPSAVPARHPGADRPPAAACRTATRFRPAWLPGRSGARHCRHRRGTTHRWSWRSRGTR